MKILKIQGNTPNMEALVIFFWQLFLMSTLLSSMRTVYDYS